MPRHGDYPRPQLLYYTVNVGIMQVLGDTMISKQRTFLIEARKRKNWKQSDLAKRMNSKQQTVSDHERGGPVSPYDALKYMDILDLREAGITLEDFYKD